MTRRLSLSFVLCLGSLVLIACPPDEPSVDGGVDAGDGDGDEDAGAGVDAGPEGCGDVTPQGECDGTVVTYCEQGVTPEEVISYDCGDRDFYPDESTTCSEVTAEYGVDCTVAAGGTCGYFDENDDFVWIFCRGDEPACLETSTTIACIENAGTCDDEAAPTCDGDLLSLACAATQPYVVDCASYGGSCDDAQDACTGLPAGATCDDAVLVCADGLDCQVGVCVLVEQPDAGPGDDDGGSADAG
jgi:hypothetical protein